MAKKAADDGAIAKPGDAPASGPAADAETAAAAGAAGDAGEGAAAVAEDGAAVPAADAVEPQPDAAPAAGADAVPADGAGGDASQLGADATATDDFAEDTRPLRFFLTLGNTAPDPDIGLTEIAAVNMIKGRARSATVSVAVDLIAEPELLKREVSAVFLLAARGDDAPSREHFAVSELVTPVNFGAGNGLHLPARSLVLQEPGDAA